MSDKKKVTSCLLGLVVSLVALPLSMFIQYSILKQVNVTDFVWFAFWFYWPLLVAVSIFSEVVKNLMD